MLRCSGAQVLRCSGAVVLRCRGAAEVQRCSGAEMQRWCRDAERCRVAESCRVAGVLVQVLQGCRCSDADVQVQVPIIWSC